MRSYSQLGTLAWTTQAKRIAVCVAATLGTLVGWPALAVDGVFEINQTCAVNTGCFAGDTAGFPVEITAAGSYRLTSNLLATGDAILVRASYVSLDLNGFRIEGDNSIGSEGIRFQNTASTTRHVMVTNGFVTDFEQGINLGEQSRIDGVIVTDCTNGVSLGPESRIRDSDIVSNTNFGVAAQVGTVAYGANFFASNQMGNFQRIGGGDFASMGGNICDAEPCERLLTRRYYLTPDTFFGYQALTACDPGFHMASIWEILDTSQLTYDKDRGVTKDDSGAGPPSDILPVGTGSEDGWIRTGRMSVGSNQTGANCSNWTGGTGHAGTSALLSFDSSASPQAVSPWTWLSGNNCGFAKHVWCIED